METTSISDYRKAVKAAPKKDKDPLVGKWFHEIKKENGDEGIGWQGHILGKVESEGTDFYLVQLFDWIVGNESNQFLVPLKDMLQWRFYNTSDEMNYYYTEIYSPRQERKAQAAKR